MAMKFSGQRGMRGPVPYTYVEPRRSDPEDRDARPKSVAAFSAERFSGVCWNIVLLLGLSGGLLGAVVSGVFLQTIMGRREWRAPLFEVLGLEVSWMILPSLLGVALFALIAITWLGRSTLVVDESGIEFRGAFRHKVLAWDKIHQVSISLDPGRRGPPMPKYMIEAGGGHLTFYVDLPRGARRRLCDAIEANGVPASNSFMVGFSPILGLLILGLPLFLILTR